MLAAPAQRAIIVGASQEENARSQLHDRGGSLVVQPANRDMGPGVFLPLPSVRAADPDATVAIYPSDHFVYPEKQLVEAVRHAVRATDLLEDPRKDWEGSGVSQLSWWGCITIDHD